MRWHGSEEQIIEVQANFGYDHGKAVLCSNIHQRAVVVKSRVKQRRELWVLRALIDFGKHGLRA